MNNQPAPNRHAAPHFIFGGPCQGVSQVSLTVKPWEKIIWFPAPLYQEPNQKLLTVIPLLRSSMRDIENKGRVNFAQNLSFPEALEFRELCPISSPSCEYRQTKLWFLNLLSLVLDTSHQCSVFNEKLLHLENGNGKFKKKDQKVSEKMVRGQNQICLKVLH